MRQRRDRDFAGEHPRWDASLAARENTPHGSDQPIEFDRRAVELFTPSGNRLFALACQRVRGQNDDRDVAGSRIALKPPRGFPAVDNGHFEVQQDDIRALADRHCATLLAILRRQHLEIAEQLEPHLEHIDVVVVVFDVKHFGHDAASIPLRAGGLLCTSRRMRSTRSAGWNLSLTSTNWTPAFNRSRSLALRSSEVMTITGISRLTCLECQPRPTPSHPQTVRGCTACRALAPCTAWPAQRRRLPRSPCDRHAARPTTDCPTA